ncbi:MAG: mechanosensitive ion channel family protein [Leptolyngbyaceae cyanobacterium bins.59]|nr:mechanosensitive ion channel family protein [Leptolyngbyaceae cyanobacterium bins.59]
MTLICTIGMMKRTLPLRYWLIAILTALAIGFTHLPIAAQIPIPGIFQPSPTRPTITPNLDKIATANVELDGYFLFTVAAPVVTNPQQGTTPPIQQRAQGIETLLQDVANRSLDPKDLKVTWSIDSGSNLPVLSINGQYLMTVTTLDAQIQGQDAERWANEIREILTNALVRAYEERQPEFLIRQGWFGGGILLATLAGSWLLARLQRRIRREYLASRSTATSPEVTVTANPATGGATIASDQEQRAQRASRNLADMRRRFLQLQQVVIWGLGSFALLGLFPYTRWLQPLLFSTPLKLLGLALVIYLAMRLSEVIIDRSLTAFEAGQFVVPEYSQRLVLRVSTLSRVLKSIAIVLWFGVGIFSALSMVGVELLPVVAGAGIVGLAVSFASQNLIKDVINGSLILLEDQYAVGDVIAVGSVSGLVEYMNLRITQLRNGEGRLITIPNGSISVVENLSKDWSRVDFAIDIAYTADLESALEVIHQVALDMDADPKWQSLIIEPPEILGVDKLAQSGVTVRIWIKTQPLEQWRVAREFRRRLKVVLDRAQIAVG